MSPTDRVVTLLPRLAEPLPDDVATLQELLRELLASYQEQLRDNDALRHRLDLLLQRLYGRRTERFRPDQPLLFAEDDAGATPATPAAGAPAATPAPRRRCRPHGRRRLPENLPRETRHHELPPAARLCPGCGQARRDIGVDRSEQLEYRPASLLVIEHVVHKYACTCGRPAPAPPAGPPEDTAPESEPMSTPPPDPAGPATPPPPTPTEPPAADPVPAPPPLVAAVIAAPKPALPIAKGLPGPGLLAHLIVSKYVDHLPLHRLERVYERQGLFVPRSTLCDWLAACAGLLRPLYTRLVTVLLESRALHTDDTTVKLQDPASHTLSTARLWVYLGDPAHPYNAFDFTRTRQRDGPQQFLANYQGYLHADAFSGYDRL